MLAHVALFAAVAPTVAATDQDQATSAAAAAAAGDEASQRPDERAQAARVGLQLVSCGSGAVHDTAAATMCQRDSGSGSAAIADNPAAAPSLCWQDNAGNGSDCRDSALLQGGRRQRKPVTTHHSVVPAWARTVLPPDGDRSNLAAVIAASLSIKEGLDKSVIGSLRPTASTAALPSKKKRGRPFGSGKAGRCGGNVVAAAVAGPVLSAEKQRRLDLMAGDEAWAKDKHTSSCW